MPRPGFLLVPLSLVLPACVTMSTERTQLKSSEVVDAACTDELIGAVDPGVAPTVHLSIADHQQCAKVERQTWAVSNYSRMAPTPRLVTAAAVTVALLGGFTALVAASTPTHLCCTTGDRVDREASGAFDVAGYALVLGVGAAIWALLGVRAESPAADEIVDTQLEARQTTRPYVGAIRLRSGATAQLDGRGADLDVAELADGAIHAGATVVPIEGPVRALLDAAPGCRALSGLDAQQLRVAVQCAHAGWLLAPDWEAQCQTRLGYPCRDARLAPEAAYSPVPWPH